MNTRHFGRTRADCSGEAVTIFAGRARMPRDLRWIHINGVALLYGMGFTMSLFFVILASAEGGTDYACINPLDLLVGSLACAIIRYLILRFATAKQQ